MLVSPVPEGELKARLRIPQHRLAAERRDVRERIEWRMKCGRALDDIQPRKASKA
jgi:hypothetical protein